MALTIDQVASIGREALIMVLLVTAPPLVLSVTVGLLVSVFQATTQIHDQTLSFMPKILAVFLSLFLFGGWMLRTLVDFAGRLLSTLAGLG